MGALGFGFPVAFALPGSAILSIGLAAVAGLLLFGDVKAFFAQDGPVEWLSAGVMNFRAIYYDFERDTLIAIPLFIFMGKSLRWKSSLSACWSTRRTARRNIKLPYTSKRDKSGCPGLISGTGRRRIKP